MVYRLNETTWLQDVGGGAEIFYFLNWAMLTIDVDEEVHLLLHDLVQHVRAAVVDTRDFYTTLRHFRRQLISPTSFNMCLHDGAKDHIYFSDLVLHQTN